MEFYIKIKHGSKEEPIIMRLLREIGVKHAYHGVLQNRMSGNYSGVYSEGHGIFYIINAVGDMPRCEHKELFFDDLLDNEVIKKIKERFYITE